MFYLTLLFLLSPLLYLIKGIYHYNSKDESTKMKGRIIIKQSLKFILGCLILIIIGFSICTIVVINM